MDLSVIGLPRRLLYACLVCREGIPCQGCTAAVFIDIRAAFDSAWRPAILVALLARYCPLYLVRLVSSFLTDRRCIFDFDPRATYGIHIGCLQGSVLSPFLWAVLIDDSLRLSRGPGRVIVGYADDISAVSASVDPVVAMGDLQLLCDLLVDWLGARKLEVCPTKSTVLIFSRRPMVLARGGEFRLSLGGVNVPHAASTRLLGFTMDQKLN